MATSNSTTGSALQHEQVEMTDGQKMRERNLVVDKDGNMVPASTFTAIDIPNDPCHYNMKSQSVTLNMNELAEMLRLSHGNHVNHPVAIPSGLGNPGALGLSGFALTTFILSAFNAGVFINGSLLGVVLPLALFYGGIAQLIAGIFEFRAPNTFGATAFISYGCFWLSFAAYVKYIVPGLDAKIANEATGIFLFVWLIFTFYMFFASMKVSKVITLVFFFLTITFLLLTIGAFALSPKTSQAGGWFGLITALIAWYGSAAIVINSTWERTVLPVGVYLKDQGFIQSWTSFGKNSKTVA